MKNKLAKLTEPNPKSARQLNEIGINSRLDLEKHDGTVSVMNNHHARQTNPGHCCFGFC